MNEIDVIEQQQQHGSQQSEQEMISFHPNDYPFRSDESFVLIDMTWTQFELYIKEFMQSLELRSRLYEPSIEYYLEMCTFLFEITKRY